MKHSEHFRFAQVAELFETDWIVCHVVLLPFDFSLKPLLETLLSHRLYIRCVLITRKQENQISITRRE